MSAGFKSWAVSAVAVAVLFCVGCTQSANPPAGDGSGAAKESAGPPQLVTAKTAFSPMYRAAMIWAPDAVFLGITAKEVPGFTNNAGKAAMWEASFGSPGLHKYRNDSYAIATVLPDIHKGADEGLALPWGGPTRDAMPIDPSTFNVDSDAAYTAAATDAADWLKKNPDKKLSSMGLGNAYKFHTPVWYVVWGDQKSGGYIAYVDAITGKVLKK